MATSPACLALLVTSEFSKFEIWVDEPWMVTLPLFEPMFWLANEWDVASLVTLPPLTETVWVEVPVMLMLLVGVDVTAMAAVEIAQSAKSASDFMVKSSKGTAWHAVRSAG